MFKSLELPDAIKRNRTLKATVRARKKELVDFARSLPGNPEEANMYHWLWESADGVYKVGVGKFGKEYRRLDIHWKDGHYGNNPNDMSPTIMKNGQIMDFDASFDHIFRFVQWASQRNMECVRVLGSLFYRNAWLVDHFDNGEGELIYLPPTDAVEYLMNELGEYDDISIEAYLHYMDAIAWNEDTKYDTLGYDIYNQGTGRENNMLTYAHLASILLGVGSLVKLCSSFSRPPVGVSPIPQNVAEVAYPDLNIR